MLKTLLGPQEVYSHSRLNKYQVQCDYLLYQKLIIKQFVSDKIDRNRRNKNLSEIYVTHAKGCEKITLLTYMGR